MICGPIFEMHTVFSPNNIPTKYVEEDKIDVKGLDKCCVLDVRVDK